MEPEEHENQTYKVKSSAGKIYFFIAALAILIATNVYYFIEYKSLGNKVEQLGSEKFQLEAELDRIEAELNRLTQDNPVVAALLFDNQNEARAQLANLRYKLTSMPLGKEELSAVQFEIDNLKYLVDEYTVSILKLKKENQQLIQEKEKLTHSINNANTKLGDLQSENDELHEKIETASNLKISGISINSIQLRSKDREKVETRAKRASLFRIDFEIVDNPLAKKGEHDLYLRIMDPNGNLLTMDDGTFQANGKNMQYTYKTSINFTNEGEQYTLDWIQGEV